MSARAPATCAASAGRPPSRRGGVRSSVRSRCRPTGRRGRCRRRARTRSSRRRCRPPGRACSSLAARQLPGRAGERQLRLLVAGDDLRLDTEDVRTPWTNSSRFSASREAEVATKRTRSAPCSLMTAAYSRQAAKVRSSASGASRPVRSTPWPSRTTASAGPGRRVCRSPGPTSATSRRIEFVPQSMAATRVRAPGTRSSGSACRAPRPSSAGTHARPLAPPLRQHRDGLVAERVDPRARGEGVRHQHVQALHPVRHAARAREALAAPRWRPGGRCSPRAPPGTRPPAPDPSASRSVISFITPFASSVPIADAARGHVR